jgi:hypothetical protein
LVVLAAAISTLDPDTASTSPLPSDSFQGLAHALPHAVVDASAEVDASADSRPAGTATAATMTGTTPRETLALIDIFISSGPLRADSGVLHGNITEVRLTVTAQIGGEQEDIQENWRENSAEILPSGMTRDREQGSVQPGGSSRVGYLVEVRTL